MVYMPIFLDLARRRCVVVGGGEVAARKTRSLLEADADVTVVSPEAAADLHVLADAGAITYYQRRYAAGDLEGAILVYAATGDSAVNAEVAAEGRARGLLVNVVDTPELCNFISPAVVRRGAMQLAISTSGRSPALARILRTQLESIIGPEYTLFTDMLGAARRRLKNLEPDLARRADIISAMLAAGLREAIARDDRATVDAILLTHLGVRWHELDIPNGAPDASADTPAAR